MGKTDYILRNMISFLKIIIFLKINNYIHYVFVFIVQLASDTFKFILKKKDVYKNLSWEFAP